MKALISAFALLTFVAGTALPVQTYAQTLGTGQTVAPEKATPPAASTKKKKSSKAHHAKKKSKKSHTGQTSSTKQKRARHSVS